MKQRKRVKACQKTIHPLSSKYQTRGEVILRSRARKTCLRISEMLGFLRPDEVVEHQAGPDHKRSRGTIMAAASDATNPSNVKVCAECGARIKRRTFCSRSCMLAANYKSPPTVDLAGEKAGRWLVKFYAGRNQRGNHAWECQCECGTSRVVEDSSLKSGSSKSCGCLQIEAVAKAGRSSVTHGMSKTAPEYYVWCSMKQRCFNPKVKNWVSYGGRGITVCARWVDSFEAFLEDMGPRPTPDHSIDRIDNDKGYHPDNCIWAPRSQQARNRRSNIIVRYQGQDMVLLDAVRLSGVKYTTAKARLKKGWTIERALTP